MKLKTLTVSQVNEYISSFISANPIFANMRVSGEVINLRKTPYGYTFLSLKDENAKINAITFLKDFDVKDADTITVYGKIDIYKKNGTYALIINSYEKGGQGQEYEKFKRLYEELEKKGYFLKENKKSLPKYPQNIGVITSANGAAIQDIISVITRRCPKINLLIYDSKMQGKDVEQNVVQGIEKFQELDVDIIIISRGGGDSDDLSIFNSKMICESIHSCNKPIISAIGHEIDFVICDFVADMRASTPSIAAEISVPRLDEVYSYISILENKINSYYKNIISTKKDKVSNMKYIIQSNAPYNKIMQKKLYISNIQLDIEKKYKNKIYKSIVKLEKITAVLQENNYKKIMSKGFSIIKKENSVVKSIEQLEKGEVVVIQMMDGSITAIIEGEKDA